MMHFLPFRAEHLGEIGEIRQACALGGTDALAALAVSIERLGNAWTGRVGDRTCACAGIFDYGGGRGNAWAMFATDLPLRAYPVLTREVTSGLEEGHRRGLARIETYVRLEFAAGVRWAQRLGFCNPFPMRKFNGGDDYWMMERIG